ncbi:MAG: diguanylate cyclase, partial [Wenzhouxiangellaceae bacterium]
GCRAWALASSGRIAEALYLRDEILNLTDSIENPDDRVRALRRAAALSQRAEKPAEAISTLSRAIELAREHSLTREQVNLYTLLGVAHSEAENRDLAIAHYEMALDMLSDEPESRQRLPILYNLALTLRADDQLERAAEIFRSLIEPLQQPGLEIRLASLYSALGGITRRQGRIDEAREWFRRSGQLHETLDNPAEHASMLTDLARLELEDGNLEEASRLAEQALSQARRADYYFTLRGALRINIDLLREKGELERALDLLEEFARGNEEYIRDQQQSQLAEAEARLGFERQARELAEARERSLELERQRIRQQIGMTLAIALLFGLLLAVWWQRVTNRKLEQVSRSDPLTGLPNRRAITWLFHRTDEIDLDDSILLVLDVDHFKQVNDRHGHDQGDRMLRRIAGALEQFAQQFDAHVGRWGGEEFIVIAPAETPRQAQRLATQLAADIRKLEFESPVGKPIRVTVSIGFAPLGRVRRESGQEPWEPAFLIADHLLFKAKQQGRDRCLGLWPADQSDLLDPHAIESQIQAGHARLMQPG